ncbi:MAG: RNA polymerase sigma factor [Geminicoccaceae bacterium]
MAEEQGFDVDRELVQHISSLRRYARALIGDRFEADDLVQETLTRAITRLRPWRGVRDLKAYLFTILHNAYIDTHRSRKRQVDDVPLDKVVNHPACPPNQLRRLELQELLACLDRLPDEQRQVVLLVGLEGMTYREVAEIMKIPLGTVMSRLSRGRQYLKRLTEQNETEVATALPKYNRT